MYRTSPTRPSRSGVLQYVFPSLQEGRGISSNSKPEGTEFVPRSTSFQNGDIEKYSASHRSQGLGTVSRSKGCVSSHCDVSGSPQISEVLLAGSALPIQGNAFRVGDCAENFYQTDGNYRKLPQKETDSGVYVSRRLADQEPGQSFAVNSIGRSPSVNSAIRSNCQQTEVQHEPVSNDTLSGVSVRHKTGHCLSFRGEVPENSRRNFSVNGQQECFSSEYLRLSEEKVEDLSSG